VGTLGSWTPSARVGGTGGWPGGMGAEAWSAGNGGRGMTTEGGWGMEMSVLVELLESRSRVAWARARARWWREHGGVQFYWK
jgi:hypothetical protein